MLNVVNPLGIPLALTKSVRKCYTASMNRLKQKYFSYDTTEFLPIYEMGRLTNMREFHAYKLKSFIEATPIGSKLLHTI